MIRIWGKWSTLFLFTLTALSYQMRAADITGTIVGTVADPSGAKIEGAQVSIISVDRGRTERSLTSDANGNFAAALLPIGKYSIIVEAKGSRYSADYLHVERTFASPVCLAYTGNTCAATGTRVTNVSPLAQTYIKDIFSRIPASAGSPFASVTPLRNICNFEQELYKLDHVFSPKLQVPVRFYATRFPLWNRAGFLRARLCQESRQ